MKIQKNNILAHCFLLMLFIATVGSIKCLGCSNVGPDNRCKTKAFECTAGKWKYCFTRKISKKGEIVKIERGCTAVCKNEYRRKNNYKLDTWCCYRQYCNSMNFWF